MHVHYNHHSSMESQNTVTVWKYPRNEQGTISSSSINTPYTNSFVGKGIAEAFHVKYGWFSQNK